MTGLLCATPSAGHAFQISSLVTHGCHEKITVDAFVLSGWPGGQTPPVLSEKDRRIIEDLPFDVDDVVRDAWGMALLIGVRDNDLRGHGPTDVAELVDVHNDPKGQSDHCLRRGEDDGPAGDQTALDACKTFILEQIEIAIGSEDRVEIASPVRVQVSLSFRGQVYVDISRFGYHIGRALHALQDGYTHTFRSPADGRVRHVLNWIDKARRSDYDRERDGYNHIGVLDDCSRSQEASVLRTTRATAASAALLDAVRDDTGGVDGRLERAEAVLDIYLELEPGCTYDNGWCDAQERFETSCSSGGGSAGTLLFVGLALLLMRGRRRAALVAVFVAILCVSSVSRAESPDVEPTRKAQASTRSPEKPKPKPKAKSQPSVRPLKQWAVYGGLAAALEHGALAETLAVRWYRWESFALGLDIEHNPWFSFDTARFVHGSFNAYATAIYRHQSRGWELRSSVYLGTSVLLFNMVGLDKGTVGAFVGISLLGVAIPIKRGYRLIIEPGHIAIPIPQVTGLPFYYGQYRVTVGIERIL